MCLTAEPELTPDQQYRQLERLLRRIVNQYRQPIPELDAEEMLSEAHVAYCQALREHDPTRGKITTWVYWRVRGRLTHLIRAEARKHKRLARRELEEDAPAPDRTDPIRLAAALNGDAGTAARLALEGPPLLPEELADRLAALGWDGTRVLTALWALRRAVQ